MNFGKSFTYMFDDPDWVSKYTIGIVISLVPILNLAWIGYAIGIMRNMAQGVSFPLPNWDNLGEKFKDGLLMAVASFVYTLPLTLFFCLGYAVILIPAMMAGDNVDAMEAMAGLGAAGYALVMCCMIVYLLVFSFFYPAMMLHYARMGTFGALFQVGEIVRIATRNIADYLMGWLAGLLAVIILGAVNVVPCIGQLITAIAGVAWLNTVTAYAYGQVGLKIGASEMPMTM